MSKRISCNRCERPVKTCLCDVMTCLSCNYQVVILQDPKEAKHALSSAPILAKSISDARLIIGEIFNPVELFGNNWLDECLLVFPSDKNLSSNQVKSSSFKYLIFLDGTWRKVSRLIHLNPWLQELPCFAIQPEEASKYVIRKSPREDGLSTIEAAVSILNTLHNDKNFSPILQAFYKMIDFQINAMGNKTFNKNYTQK